MCSDVQDKIERKVQSHLTTRYLYKIVPMTLNLSVNVIVIWSFIFLMTINYLQMGYKYSNKLIIQCICMNNVSKRLTVFIEKNYTKGSGEERYISTFGRKWIEIAIQCLVGRSDKIFLEPGESPAQSYKRLERNVEQGKMCFIQAVVGNYGSSLEMNIKYRFKNRIKKIPSF